MAKKSKRERAYNKIRASSRKKRDRAELKRLNIPLTKPKEFTSQNHYVPQWYQRKFLLPNEHHFYYMDLYPEVVTIPGGETYKKRECLRLGTSRCFKQEHLYTLELFNHKSDIIERELFGDIDTRGSNSFDIFFGEDAWQQEKAHEKFNNFIEFMDAQKLRTPKGMNFIKSLCLLNQQTPNKLIVLGLLQQYRKMHCAMWIESIWEVVNAKNSRVKFIICDHPVIAYNSRIPSSINVCGLFVDPPISLLGTHTIYPLDLDHCLILTHRQYALDPDNCNPLDERINARYGDKAIFSFQNIIYTRSLCDNDVEKINYITKTSALKYIASSDESWLFPERNIQSKWEEVGDILLPPKDKITLTQSIVFRHRDGSTEAYDAFGRNISEQETKDFRGIVNKITLGDKLSKILDDDSKTDLHKKSLVLLNSIKEIFEISNTKRVKDLKKELNEEQVRKLYHVVADLFPHKMDFCSLIPVENKFRGVFLGDINPHTITRDISNLIHLFDEIYIINPFHNPYSMKDEYSPLSNPGRYLRDTYRLVLSIIMLENFIQEGMLIIAPAPDEFDYPLKMKIFRIAKKRAKNIRINDRDLLPSRTIDTEMQQLVRSFPKDYLRKHIKESSINISEEEIEQVLEYIDNQSQHDITDLGRSMDETGGQFIITRSGMNLENTILFCRLTGAVPVTYIPFKYKEFLSVANNSSGCKRWNPLIKLFDDTNYIYDYMGDQIFNHFLKTENYFKSFRTYLNQVYIKILNDDPRSHNQNIRLLCQDYPKIKKEYADDWHDAIIVYEDWLNRLPKEIRKKFPFNSQDIFKKGEMKIVLGDINMPFIDYLLKIHFPQKKSYKIVPMAIYMNYSIEQK